MKTLALIGPCGVMLFREFLRASSRAAIAWPLDLSAPESEM